MHVVVTQLLQLLILRPRTRRDTLQSLRHIHKPSLNHPFAVEMRHLRLLPNLFEGNSIAVGKIRHGFTRRNALVGVEPAAEIGDLEPPPGRKVRIRLLVQLLPIRDGAAERAAVDEIERARGAVGPETYCKQQSISRSVASRHRGLAVVRPLTFNIVHLETKIGRDVGRLDWGEVVGHDFGVGVVVGDVNGPDTRASA